MTGLKKSIDILTDWNKKNHKLSDNDIKDLAIKFSSISKVYKKRTSTRQPITEHRDKIINLFKENDMKLLISVVKLRCGSRFTTIISMIRKNGYDLEIMREFHKQKPVSYYVLKENPISKKTEAI